MRRTDLIASLSELSTAISQSGIGPALADLSRPVKEVPGEVVARGLDALSSYRVYEARFTSNTRELTKIFDLDSLSDARIWSTILSREQRDVAARWGRSIREIRDFLPRIIDLLQSGSHQIVADLKHRSEVEDTAAGVLTVILIEEGERLSRPGRLTDVLDSVAEMYYVYATINNSQPDDLSVLACDSGSDKSFDFLGAAKVVSGVKELILAVWDRIMFFREVQMSHRLKLVSEALPVIDQIGELETNGRLEREQAEILKRKVIGSVSKFVSSGAIIPEISANSSFSPRSLMAPEVKMLAPPPRGVDVEASNPPQPPAAPVLDGLDEEEIALIRDMLARRKTD